MERKTIFADVILPLAIPNLYTYRVPYDWNEVIAPGQRVVVQFGRNKLYTAIVRKLHESAPTHYQAKYLESILDEKPIVNAKQFAFWDWLSTYYMCTVGEVMNAALPGTLRLASETRLVLNPSFGGPYDGLTDKEFLIFEALEIREVLSLKEVAEILGQKTVYPLVKSLLEKKVVYVEEELKERYKPRTKSYVRLTEFASKEENLQGIFQQIEKRAPKQSDALMAYLKDSGYSEGNEQPMLKTELQERAGATSAVINQLVKKDVFVVEEIEVGRLAVYDGDQNKELVLTDQQAGALSDLRSAFEEKNTALLYGVTSSGKTEVYVQLIKEQIAQGKQVLYLLPEIALTTQIINRLKRYFGDEVGVYHSRFNQNERVEVWNEVLKGKESRFKVLLGARSAVFLPFVDLGLIIVDEEHENTFKQYDPAPRYNARDAAVVMAHLHGCKTLLGSATPSVETHWNARQGRYGYAEMTKRFGGIKLPEILISDIRKAMKRKEMHSLFTGMLLDHIKHALESGEQIILFQNRRGYSPLWSCEMCAWTPGCERCDVSLTYHKFAHQLRCHYCGFNLEPPVRCEACGSTELKMIGFGTEKIEEELQVLLPDARIARMDLDTTRAKNAYQKIIGDFEEKRVDVLVGTQMVTKGLDFDNVGLVGVLNADSMLRFPDFRAFERAYQLMAQVSGRAGRKGKRGKVVIQTYTPDHWVINKVIANDYAGMYQQEVVERRNYHYPPFYRLTELTLKHRDRDLVNVAAAELAQRMRKRFGARVLGPEFPPVARIKNLYHKNIMLKVERNANTQKVKGILQDMLDAFKQEKDFKSVRIGVDVDPM